MSTNICPRIKCSLKFHDYEVTQQFSLTTFRISCTQCGSMWFYDAGLNTRSSWNSKNHMSYSSQGVEVYYLPWEGVSLWDKE